MKSRLLNCRLAMCSVPSPVPPVGQFGSIISTSIFMRASVSTAGDMGSSPGLSGGDREMLRELKGDMVQAGSVNIPDVTMVLPCPGVELTSDCSAVVTV